jgi:orotate phosphoribosyltransferase-like protein
MVPSLRQKILELQQQGVKRKDIASSLDVKISYVHCVIRKYGTKLSKEQRRANVADGRQASAAAYLPGTTDKILELQQQGMKRKDIAASLGIDINKVISDIQRSDKRLTSEQRANTHRVFDEVTRGRVSDLRRNGVALQEICTKTGLSYSTVRYLCSTEGVTLTHEQKSVNMREIDRDLVASLRSSGMTVLAIASEVGASRGGVKTILVEEGIVLDPLMKQQNVWAGLIAKNPYPMAHMRQGLTPEVVALRSAAIKKRYSEDSSLRELKSLQTMDWWKSMDKETRENYLEKRHQAFLDSPATKDYLTRLRSKSKDENFYNQAILRQSARDTMSSIYEDLAKSHEGRMVDEYRGSYKTITWECMKGHIWEARPNSIQQGSWCPYCAHTGPSKAQLELADYVKSLLPDIEVLVGDRAALKSFSPNVDHPLELDIYVPSLKKAIEFDGWFWHKSPWAISRGVPDRDVKKDAQCLEAKVELLRVDELEFNKNRESVLNQIRDFFAPPRVI